MRSKSIATLVLLLGKGSGGRQGGHGAVEASHAGLLISFPEKSHPATYLHPQSAGDLLPQGAPLMFQTMSSRLRLHAVAP